MTVTTRSMFKRNQASLRKILYDMVYISKQKSGREQIVAITELFHKLNVEIPAVFLINHKWIRMIGAIYEKTVQFENDIRNGLLDGYENQLITRFVNELAIAKRYAYNTLKTHNDLRNHCESAFSLMERLDKIKELTNV